MKTYLQTIDRQMYLKLIESHKHVNLKDVDLSQYSNYYYRLYSNERGTLAVCGVHLQKNEIKQINGLISFNKGSGKDLLNSIEGKFIRLNCTQELYDKYYSKLGFQSYLTLGNYIECIKVNNED